MLLTSLTLAALFVGHQDSPVAIPKADLPKKATCAVCEANGAGHEEEKPAAGT